MIACGAVPVSTVDITGLNASDRDTELVLRYRRNTGRKQKMNNSNEKLRVLSKILPIGVGILGFQGQRL